MSDVTIHNLERRREFWSVHSAAACQGATVPIDHHIDPAWFYDRDVLEIGPGEGRQTRILKGMAANYAVADICQEVLDRFPNLATMLLSGYEPRTCPFVDTVTFWYVLHHVTRSEGLQFLKFVHSCLHPVESSLIVFNSCRRSGGAGDDGMITTERSDREIRELLEEAGFCLKHYLKSQSGQLHDLYVASLRISHG